MNRILLTVLVAAALGISGVAHAAGDAAAGKAKAASCGVCHGANGEGTKMGPKLAGMPSAGFVQAMNEYKSGTRANAMMKAAANPLSADDIANLAAYYATLK